MGFKPATRVEALVTDLCLTYGICLPPQDLIKDPPSEPNDFVEAILIAEGFDPMLVDKQVSAA
jgi:hypothetical protein